MDQLELIHAHTVDRISQGKLVCAATLVAQNGKLLWNERQGWSDYEKKEPLKENAIFRLASMTKPITAAAAMVQVERKEIDLYENVSRYIPAFKNMTVAIFDDNKKVISTIPAQTEIRLIDLLTHCNAMGQEDPFGPTNGVDLQPKPGDTLATIVPRLDNLLLFYNPRTQCGYSQTLAFDTMAYIIELTSGMGYEDFLRETIFKPLGMRDTTFTPNAEQKSRLVNSYSISQDGIRRDDLNGNIMPYVPQGYTAGGAGLAGSIEDYYRFTQMLANDGELDGTRILSSDSVALMQTPQHPNDLPGLTYGINWGLAMRVITKPDADTPLKDGSYGWSGAFGTHFWIDPRSRLLAIYCTSIVGNDGAGPEAFEFERDVSKSIYES